MIWGQTTAHLIFWWASTILCPPWLRLHIFSVRHITAFLDLTTNTTKHLCTTLGGLLKQQNHQEKAKNVENITRKRPQRGCLFSLWELKHKGRRSLLTQLRTQLGKYLETDFGLTNIFKMIKWVHKYRIYEWRLYLRINVTAFCQCQIKCH